MPKINIERFPLFQPEPEAQASASVESPMPEIPEDAIIVLPVRNVVLYPGIVLPLTVGRKASVAAAQEAARNERPIGVVLQRDAEVENPKPDDLYGVGTVASILRYVTGSDKAHHLICQGEQRFRVKEFLSGYPFLVARIERLDEREEMTNELEARMHRLKERARESLELIPQAPAELGSALEAMTSPAALADMIASFMDIKPAEKQEVLETFDIQTRLDRVLKLLNQRIEVMRLSHEIGQQTKEAMDERQREYLLREQLRTIQKELGEGEGKDAEIEELARAIDDAGMPKEVEEEARKELRRLERMPEAAAEYSMSRTYMDWMLSLPWAVVDEENIDIKAARETLDRDHYGLEKIKRRILEYLAVRKLNPQGRSPILCFVGPPGVGKTSLGQSIARAVGLKFVRASLGGVHDESEIRGHRRTYVGALPGNIIQGIRKAGTRNPVFMLDEMDKLGAGFHGDPSAALLEVLDPEQNSTFRDNYLAVPFDLSKVMFIATANVLDTIPGPLRDRMEIIELTGYTEDEKVEIARRYLVARQLEAERPGRAALQHLGRGACAVIVRDYTREAGCRNLEREIGKVFRNVAVARGRGHGGTGVDRRGRPARAYSAPLASRAKSPCAPACPAWPPAWPGRRWAATSCSSRPAACPATAS